MIESNESDLGFHQMGLDDRILEAIARLKWTGPTPIQESAIPYFLKGKDILARARTGSGKTGAYLVPLIHKILEQKSHSRHQTICALIIAPSKELCHQICHQISLLTSLGRQEVKCLDLSPRVPLEAQKQLLGDRPDIVVGTPLKILSHMNAGNLDLKKSLQYLIIDEADLLVAYESENDLDAVLKNLPSLRQSFLTSATLPDDVTRLKKLVLNKPVVLKLEEPPVPDRGRLAQYVIKVEAFDKMVLLYALIRLNILKGKTIIFVNSVNKAYKVRMFLAIFGIRTCVLNCELPVNCRCRVIERFNENKFRIMIASDEKELQEKKKVKRRKRDSESGVSRGIDFEGVSNVVNLDFPPDPTTYIHRVGRTARGSDHTGTALNFVAPSEMRFFRQIRAYLAKELATSSDQVPPNIFEDYKFNMAALDGFRYRAEDAWKQCTSVAVRDFRRQEIQKEMMVSQKLKHFFENNPADWDTLSHSHNPKLASSVQSHLKNVPDYNIPETLRRVVARTKKNSAKIPPRNLTKGRKKFLNRSQDPLRAVRFSQRKNKMKN